MWVCMYKQLLFARRLYLWQKIILMVLSVEMYVNLFFLKLFVHHNLLNSWRLIQVCYYYLHLTDCVPFHLHLRLCSVSFAAHILCSVSFAAHKLCSVSFASHRLCSVSSAAHRLCSVSFTAHRLCSVSFAAHILRSVAFAAHIIIVWYFIQSLNCRSGLERVSLLYLHPPPTPPPHPHTPMMSACCLIANTHVSCMFLQYNIQYNNTLLILKKETQFHAVWY